MASSALLPRSLRSRGSVKDVWRHFVKDVMRLNRVILAWGLPPIPANYSTGSRMPCTVVFIDQYENESRREVQLFADRTWKSKRVVPVPDGGLYRGSPQQHKIEDINVITSRSIERPQK
jgi:hypothetical protein